MARLELTNGNNSTKEKVTTHQKRSWTTGIFRGEVASKEGLNSYAEENILEGSIEYSKNNWGT